MDHSIVDRLVGLRIKEARDAVQLKPEALARDMNISLDDLYRYESGNARINAETLGQFSKCLDKPISYFFERDWEKDAALMQVNMVALTQLCRLFLPAMGARKSG